MHDNGNNNRSNNCNNNNNNNEEHSANTLVLYSDYDLYTRSQGYFACHVEPVPP